jgi:hypothetical protein
MDAQSTGEPGGQPREDGVQMKWLAGAIVAVVSLVAAFSLGMWYQRVDTPAPPIPATSLAAPTVAPPAPVAVADDPVKRLQLDTLCGQSASAFNSEHEMKGDGSQNMFEHSYNAHLAKCFVLLRSFLSGPTLGTNYSVEEDTLYDAVSGTTYGNYRVKAGPGASGPVHREVILCSTFPDGVTLHQCTSEEEWRLYSDSLMHE